MEVTDCRLQVTHLNRDDAAWFVVVRLARVVPVQLVELWVEFIAKGFLSHRAEVKMETVQQEVDFHPGPSGLWPHSRGRTQHERGAVDCAARFELTERTGTV